MTTTDLDDLTRFIVRAKAHTYAASSGIVASSRPGSHDLQFTDGPFTYIDTYVGGADFLGQELVVRDRQPVWALNYYGYLLRPDLIDAATSGATIKACLTGLYAEGRFLGGWHFEVDPYTYTDTNDGEVTHFTGTEWIDRDGVRVYELVYHGGLVRER
ncbi:MAG TPA: DUF5680 domain-containing protein [Demequina sp.]|jgi:Domain of unknown function (DUF5680)|nr:DUF5680 domain-containing protein [Cellulomonas sp.]HZL81714.1 DUF5680 domain-containing protein [Demequina sp.]